VGPLPGRFYFFLVCEILSAESHLCSQHMCTERIWRGSRQRSLFAGWVLPSGLCRELPLGRGSAERKTTFVKRIGALGRGIESGSV
jgi:hypothetical protein